MFVISDSAIRTDQDKVENSWE